MPQQERDGSGQAHERPADAERDATFKRHGPEPPENDSGPSPSVDEMTRGAQQPRVDEEVPQEQVD